MTDLLATVIDEARRQAFVGRAAEFATFDELLGGDGPRRVLFIHGPGGIGKSTLLDQFRLRAREGGRSTVTIDGFYVDCSAEGVQAAFDRAVARDGPGQGLAGRPRAVLLLDSYERLALIDNWIRNEFLPALPAGVVVVIAGRQPPSAPWRTDPGWRAIVAVHALGRLSDTESLELLARAGLPEPVDVRLAPLAQGHPLTLALLADAAVNGRAVPDDLADAPDLVAALVSQVVGDVPSEAHATALAVCAYTWLTTEDLLRRAVGDAAPEIWSWLASQPYVTRGTDGLYPHDLVRDVLDADLRRRSPDGYLRVHWIVHQHVMSHLLRPDVTDRQLWAHHKLWLHRRGPLWSAYWLIRENGSAAVVPGRPADHPEVLAAIERFEGPESAALAARWLDAQPENLFVVRAPTGIAAYVHQVVYPTDPSLCDADPVVRAVLDEAARISPARPGEQIWIGRFFGGTAEHQHDPYAAVIGPVVGTIEWVTRPLAWTFVVSIAPDIWGPIFAYSGFTHESTLDHGGQRYTLYAIDWRRCPVDVWLDMLGERELTGATGPPPPERLRPPPLDRAAFGDAVRAALRDLHHPDRLQASPLIGSALAFGFRGSSPGRLGDVLRAGIDQLGREPRSEPLHRVLDRTYVRAAPTQEAAAEVLGLPFSTYRRHLARAIERLTDLLWAVEIGQVRLDPEL